LAVDRIPRGRQEPQGGERPRHWQAKGSVPFRSALQAASCIALASCKRRVYVFLFSSGHNATKLPARRSARDHGSCRLIGCGCGSSFYLPRTCCPRNQINAASFQDGWRHNHFFLGFNACMCTSHLRVEKKVDSGRHPSLAASAVSGFLNSERMHSSGRLR